MGLFTINSSTSSSHIKNSHESSFCFNTIGLNYIPKTNNKQNIEANTITFPTFLHLQNFLLGFSVVFETHIFIDKLQPHLSDDEFLLPPITNLQFLNWIWRQHDGGEEDTMVDKLKRLLCNILWIMDLIRWGGIPFYYLAFK